ncbi:hypothetical protein [Rheinheimera fenheensis]|uniref:hypothetical protein n=1 Tax=Rheinheimera fenheensis TaxID=3152295 RepID=UPI00325F0F66
MIYIIEDNILKSEQIIDFLNAKFNLDEKEVSVFMSFQSGLKAIESKLPRMVILDMTLPTFDRKPNAREGRLRPLGGYDLMRKMALKGLKCQVIVVTQLESFGDGEDEIGFDEITEKCSSEFPDLFVGSVYFDQGGVTWRGSLESMIIKTSGG